MFQKVKHVKLFTWEPPMGLQMALHWGTGRLDTHTSVGFSSRRWMCWVHLPVRDL